MMQFPPLPASADFTGDATINDARDELKGIFEAALPGFVNDNDRIEFPKKLNGKKSDHWGRFKDHFARAQSGRCGYCELAVIGAQFGDV